MAGPTLALPAELERFLALPRPTSLLIRGGSGTGRSLLARAIAGRSGGEVLLLSDSPGAVDPEGWATAMEARVTVHPIWETGAEVARGAVSPPGTPPPRSTTVVDTWEALAEQVLGRARRGSRTDSPETERELFHGMARACHRFIAVMGSGRTSTLEYLIDGIVETSQTEEEDRPERWLRLVKLRGVELVRTHYPFTLTKGQFQVVNPLEQEKGLVTVFPDPDPAPDSSSLWPGAADFASAFGRLPLGGLTIVEVDPRASTDVALSFVIPLLLHALGHGSRVAFVPPPTLFPEDLFPRARAVFSTPDLNDLAQVAATNLRILSHVDAENPDPLLSAVMFKIRPPVRQQLMMASAPEQGPEPRAETARESTKPRFPELQEFLRGGNPETVNLELAFLNGLVAAARELGTGYAPEALAAILQRDLSTLRLHSLLVAEQGDPLIHPLYGLASLHLRIVRKDGYYFVHGMRPWTTNYVLTIPPTGSPGAPPFRLIAVR